MVTDVNPDPLNALGPMLFTDDGMTMDLRPVAFRKALAPMLVYVAIRALVAPYNNEVTLGNDPLLLNTLVIHDTLIPDLLYNVLLPPGMIPRPSSKVDSAKMALVIPDELNPYVSINVTEAGMVIDFTLGEP